MFNFLENTTVDDILGLDGYSCATSDFFPILEATKFIIRIIQIAVPFGLIIWGSLDWFKALIAHDEKEMRMKRKPFLARVIAAMIVLVLPWIMTLISKVVAGESNTADFWTCYHEAKPRIDFTKLQQRNNGTDDIIRGFYGTGPTGGATSNGSSGNTSTSSGDSSTNFAAPTSKTIKDNCSDFTSDGESACNNGMTNTYTCQWQMGRCTEKSRREIYTSNCSDYKTVDSCNSGMTQTHYCAWTGDQYGCQPSTPR